MSISGAVLALNLVLNSSVVISSNQSVDRSAIHQPDRIAQIPLDKYDDGIKAGRAEVDRLIEIVRTRPNLTARQRAVGIFKLYSRRASELNQQIEQGLVGTYILLENKEIIIQRWTTERNSLQKLAEREIEPYLTAKERKLRDLLNDPVKMKQLRDEATRQAEAEQKRRDDANKLRGIIPQ
jgi:hypothetical protein